MTTPCEPVKRRPRRVKPAVGTVEHVQQTGWKTVAQPTARNLPAALLSLNRRLFLALSHGSAILTQHPICSTPPLRNLPLIHRYDECLLWVVRVSWGFRQPGILLAYARAKSSDIIGRRLDPWPSQPTDRSSIACLPFAPAQSLRPLGLTRVAEPRCSEPDRRYRWPTPSSRVRQ